MAYFFFSVDANSRAIIDPPILLAQIQMYYYFARTQYSSIYSFVSSGFSLPPYCLAMFISDLNTKSKFKSMEQLMNAYVFLANRMFMLNVIDKREISQEKENE